MAFNTQEQEILKWGVANGKSRQEVEEAISNFRSGIVPQKVQPVEQPSLVSKLGERAKTFGKEAVTLGTLGASTMTPQDFNATGQDRSLAALQGLNRAGQSPIRMAGAVGGAIGDVVGAGLEATGLDKPIGQVLAPIAESQPVQKAMEVFKSLPQETQEVLGAIVNTANIPISGAGLGVAKTGIQKAGQVATETVAPLAKKVLPKLTPDAEQIMQRVARVSKGKQANFEARAGESIGAYLDKRGIYGDVDQITEQLYNRFQQSKGTADEALASLQGNYQPTAVRTALAELEKKLTRVSSEGAVDPNLGKVSGLLAKFDNQGLTMSEINEAKRLYERNVKLDFLRENNPEGITTANNIDNAIRSWQFNQAEKLGLKNLPEINKETMLAKQLLDDLGKEYAGSAGNNMITLTDWIVLSGGDPTAVAGFLTKQGLSSKKVQSFIAKLISKNQPKKGQVTPQTGEATVLPIGTYKDFLKETSKTSKPTTQPQVKKGLSPQPNSTTKEGVVNELINNPLRGSVTPSEFLPKKKVGSESTSLYHGTENTDITNFIPSKTGDLGSGVYLTRDKNTALRFSDPSFRNSSLEPKGNGEYVNINTGETYKPPKPGVIDINGSNLKIYKIKPGEIQDEISKLRDPKTKVLPVGYENMVQQKFKKMGYDGIEVTGTPRGENDQVLIFPESVNKLKINKSISPLEQEAKKYKSGSVDNLKQELNTVIQTKAPQAKEFIDNLVKKSISQGDIHWNAPNKTLESAFRKLTEEKQGVIADMHDLARTSAIGNTAEARNAIVKKLSSIKELADQPRHQTPDAFMGYEGWLFKVRSPSGLISEVQVVSPEMVYGKAIPAEAEKVLGAKKMAEIERLSGVKPGVGHLIYEDMRKLTPMEKLGDKGKALAEKSIAYYSKLRKIQK